MSFKEKFDNSVQRVKTHFKENKQVYITGGVCFVIGAGSMYLSTRDGQTTNKSVQSVVALKTGDIHQHMDVHIEALGDPGNVVQDVDTGTIYASQSQAARVIGVNPGRISDHINGRTPDVKGHTFVKLGKAHVNNTP